MKDERPRPDYVKSLLFRVAGEEQYSGGFSNVDNRPSLCHFNPLFLARGSALLITFGRQGGNLDEERLN